MSEKAFLTAFFVIFSFFVKAQSADKVYEQYADFNLARLDNNTAKALLIGETILPNADKLPVKSRTIFYNGIAKMYENSKQTDKAIRYYEMVTAAEPDYYVAHRALGYLYLNAVNDLFKKLNATADRAAKMRIEADYKKAALKVLPHLERSQACDPDESTLHIIKTLYSNLDDNAALTTLNSRLAALGKKCVSILTE